MNEKLGLVHVYTGDGKGKTTAALGLGMRAVGQGFKVYMIQFMKGGAYTGEFISAKNYLPNITIVQYGRGCIKQQKQLKLVGINKGLTFFDAIREDIECGACRWCFLNDDQQKTFVRQAYEHALHIVGCGKYDLIILDEINVASSYSFLSDNEIIDLISRRGHTELVLTGRGANDTIIEVADLVTDMKLVKHYYNKGVSARRGIEY